METRRKQFFLVFALLLCVFLLTGCSFSDLMSRGTGISNDPDYKMWARLSGNGQLDENGEFATEPVHVSFAENGLLDIKYYSDSELQNEISTENCNLLPGDLIFASATVTGDAARYYAFDHLDVIHGYFLGYRMFYSLISSVTCKHPIIYHGYISCIFLY